MKDNQENCNDALRNSILNDNKLLFKMYSRPCTETCMCWGLEFAEGWLQPFSDAAYALEGLNQLAYAMHRVYVQSSQVKEKYGTLRWSYDVVCDPCSVICAYERFSRWLMDKIGKVDFRQKRVVDKEAYVSNEVKELSTPEEIADAERSAKMCSNVFVEERNGKKVKLTKLEHCAVTHYEATKHRLLWAIWRRRHHVIGFLRNLFKWEPSHEQEAVMAYLDAEAQRIIKQAEEACYCTCEQCGRQIGSDWSPRCQTRGWISYICDECAKKSGREYYKNGALWREKECIKTKKEVDAERKAIEDKINARVDAEEDET